LAGPSGITGADVFQLNKFPKFQFGAVENIGWELGRKYGSNPAADVGGRTLGEYPPVVDVPQVGAAVVENPLVLGY
jgi:hypothetical protein